MAKDLKDRHGRRVHSYIPELTEQLRRGEIGRREFLRTATLLGVSAGAAYGLAGSIEGRTPVASARAETPKTGGKLRMGMRVRELSDPATFSSVAQSNQLRGVLEHLVVTGEDNITRPHLAESWDASEDLKTWTFTLRKNVTWSNGDAFTADDVVANFARWLDPSVGSSNLGLFSSMVDEVDTGKTDDKGKTIVEKRMSEGAVEKVDDHTVRLHLNRAELAIPENLYNYPTAIVHRRFAEEGGDFTKTPVSTGPFVLDALVHAERCVVKRRADYWGRPAHLDEIHYIDTGDDTAAALSAFASKQIDLVYQAEIEQLDVIERLPDAVLYQATTAQTGVARMQVDKAPFDDKRVRQALVACMDHAAILKLAHRDLGAPGENHHVAPIHPEYFALPKPKQDYELAKKLLGEAGHGDGLTIKIDVANATGPWELNAIQVLRQQLEPAGITLDINTMPASAFWDIWTKTPFGFTPWTHRPLGVMTLNLAYRSGVPWNESRYSNPDFDAALDDAGSILDAKQRSAAMERVQRILQEDAVIAQPLWRAVFTAGRDSVKGFSMHPTLYHDLSKVWLA